MLPPNPISPVWPVVAAGRSCSRPEDAEVLASCGLYSHMSRRPSTARTIRAAEEPDAKVRAGWLADRGAPNGLESVGVIAVEDRMRTRRKISEKRMSTGVNTGSELSPMGGRHRGTAVAILAAHRLDFATAGALFVHRLPHTAGMGRRSRDRHGRRDKRASKQEHKQQSGG
jgi:hypothetical protein